MPAPALKSLAEKYGVPFKKAEEFWKKAKEQYCKGKKKKDCDWEAVMGATKKMMKNYSKSKKVKKEEVIKENELGRVSINIKEPEDRYENTFTFRRLAINNLFFVESIKPLVVDKKLVALVMDDKYMNYDYTLVYLFYPEELATAYWKEKDKFIEQIGKPKKILYTIQDDVIRESNNLDKFIDDVADILVDEWAKELTFGMSFDNDNKVISTFPAIKENIEKNKKLIKEQGERAIVDVKLLKRSGYPEHILNAIKGELKRGRGNLKVVGEWEDYLLVTADDTLNELFFVIGIPKKALQLAEIEKIEGGDEIPETIEGEGIENEFEEEGRFKKEEFEDEFDIDEEEFREMVNNKSIDEIADELTKENINPARKYLLKQVLKAKVENL